MILIPAQDKKDDLTGASGALITTLNELFNDVRDTSENFREAQKYLNLLADELDPSNENSEIGRMMTELNDVLRDVFPSTGIQTATKLSDADKVIKPQFTVSMSSNIQTSVELQGTGAVRAAVFALLRYRALRENTRQGIRPLIIGFEEPELYLHPNAAQQMRDTIYMLASTANNQIICTTHSPYMIDLSQRPRQVLNLLSLKTISIQYEGQNCICSIVNANPFNISEAFLRLQDDERDYVKMLLKIDDYVAKIFFSKNVLIIEGDTEEIVLKKTFEFLPLERKQKIMHNWQIIKARGKAAIISLVKYLKSMGINPYVIHDLDIGNEKAEIFNQSIMEAVGDDEKLFPLQNCIEDILGYEAPTYDKPYKAYRHIKEHWVNWNTVPDSWKNIFNRIFI